MTSIKKYFANGKWHEAGDVGAVLSGVQNEAGEHLFNMQHPMFTTTAEAWRVLEQEEASKDST